MLGAIFPTINLVLAPIEQSDGTSWMAMFCLNMLKIATELAKKDKDLARIYE
ncbi:hypothetical protein [Microcoleus sp. FACHB-68]|uniref:hypothetical protein n=1 Tax=Microcoleus sp. FACHB-68 TaxID=2692826 RepID=UPI001688E5AB|nr:hypothetical protein [Microcoleus sp. FACHB-68]MBD1936135.1 hypothetical protein [Microcoleus sp. FACHB-68]